MLANLLNFIDFNFNLKLSKVRDVFIGGAGVITHQNMHDIARNMAEDLASNLSPCFL